MPDETLKCPACGREVAADDRDQTAYRRVETFLQAPSLLAIHALAGGADVASPVYTPDAHERALCEEWRSRLVDEQGNPLDTFGRGAWEAAADANSGRQLVAEKIIELTETLDYYDQDDVRTKVAEIRKLARRGLTVREPEDFTGVRLIPADEHSTDVWRSVLDGQMLGESQRAVVAAERVAVAIEERRQARAQHASDIIGEKP
jgi:hypothetical protein